MVRLMRFLVAILAVFLGLAFHVKNSGTVSLNLYLRSFELPLSLVVVATLILGALLGLLAMSWRVFVLTREIGRLRRQAALVRTSTQTTAVVPVQHGS